MLGFNISLQEIFSQGIPILIIDLFLSFFLFYLLYKALKGTKAIPLLKGLGVLFLFSIISQKLSLKTFSGLLQLILGAIVIALPVLFQPELRRALEHLGKRSSFYRWLPFNPSHSTGTIEAVAQAAEELAKTRTGALIVLEREASLKEVEESGLTLDALVSKELLSLIFQKNASLHDGAVLIRGSRLIAASCLLPISQRFDLPSELGTRHRAGIGLTEQTDALAVIVSEERGSISVAKGGNLVKFDSSDDLLAYLSKEIAERWDRNLFTATELFRRRMGD